jgi:uncharacterized protein YbaP (TraB family)
MKNMTIKKATVATSLCASLLFINTASAESSVWKVSKNNDVVYIGGTLHILPKSEFPLPTEFTNAYKMVDTIVLETKFPDQSDSNFQAQMMQKMSYSNGKKITDFLSKSTHKQLNEYMAGFGANLKDFSDFKPGFITTMMAIMEAQRSNISGDGVDVYFNELAVKDNKGIEYLETITFQLDMLSNMGLGNEESFMKSNLAQMNDFKSMFTKLIKAWRIGDEVTLNDIVIIPMQENPATLKALLTDRNKNWLPKIEKMFGDNDKEFVLVGAAHLIGEKSVLGLLKAKGYKVEKFK